jgi:hypothetical protein
LNLLPGSALFRKRHESSRSVHSIPRQDRSSAFSSLFIAVHRWLICFFLAVFKAGVFWGGI